MLDRFLAYSVRVPGFQLTGPVLLGLTIAALLAWLAFARLFARVGLSPWLSLLMLLPGVNLLALLGLAYGSWPITRELSGLRRVQRAAVRATERQLGRAA